MNVSGLFRVRRLLILPVLATISFFYISGSALASTYGSSDYGSGYYGASYQSSTTQTSGGSAPTGSSSTPTANGPTGSNDSTGTPLLPTTGGSQPTEVTGSSSGWTTWLYGSLIALAVVWLFFVIVRRRRRTATSLPPTYIPPSY